MTVVCAHVAVVAVECWLPELSITVLPLVEGLAGRHGRKPKRNNGEATFINTFIVG